MNMNWKSTIVLDHKSIKWKRTVILIVILRMSHDRRETSTYWSHWWGIIGMLTGENREFMDEMWCAWIQNYIKFVGSALQLDENWRWNPAWFWMRMATITMLWSKLLLSYILFFNDLGLWIVHLCIDDEGTPSNLATIIVQWFCFLKFSALSIFYIRVAHIKLGRVCSFE